MVTGEIPRRGGPFLAAEAVSLHEDAAARLLYFHWKWIQSVSPPQTLVGHVH